MAASHLQSSCGEEWGVVVTRRSLIPAVGILKYSKDKSLQGQVHLFLWIGGMGAPKCGVRIVWKPGHKPGKNSHEAEQRTQKKFIGYTPREQRAGQQTRGCLQGGSGWGLF